jgi:oxygen-independent coproporphyrinogen-3 oxidase
VHRNPSGKPTTAVAFFDKRLRDPKDGATMDLDFAGMSAAELDDIVATLGPPGQVVYAPPNIYPMSAPRFESRPGAVRDLTGIDKLGVYLHVPFCNYQCTFCFYATRLTPAIGEQQAYVAAVQRELAGLPADARLTQLYVGGGTPTALAPQLLSELLGDIFRRLRRDPGIVHTVECSPESITVEHVEVIRDHGIERVSMGVQTLSDGVLDTVHRRHSAQQVLDACHLLVGSGLMVNIDLIYGLPGQTIDSFLNDFRTISSTGVHSFTAYNLRVNERTPVGRALEQRERFDLVRLIHWRAAIMSAMERSGFEPARWHTFRRTHPQTAADAVGRFEDITGQGDQFGAGMSARSRLQGVVYRNHSKYMDYMRCIEAGQSPVQEVFPMSPEEQRLRFVTLSLGDGKPLLRGDYLDTFGRDIDDDFAEPLSRLRDARLVDDDHRGIRLNRRGQLLYDLVTRLFYPQPVRHWLDQRQQLVATAANLRPAKV